MESNHKNVLLLIPNLDFGGAQRSICKLSIHLSSYCNIFLGVFNQDNGIAFPFEGKLLDLNVPGGSNIFYKIYYFLLRIYRLKKLKKMHNINCTISFLEGADYVNILSRISNEKIIISIRGSKSDDGDISGWLGWTRKKILIPFLYRRTDYIVAVSEGIKEELINLFSLPEKKISTIYNFYDLDLLYNQSQELIEEKYIPIFKNYQVLINAGRFHPQKNFKSLLYVFAEVKKYYPDLKLVLVGDGELRNDLIQTSKNLGLHIYSAWEQTPITYKEDVYFLGFDSNPLKFIRLSTLFTFSSSWEGFPNALAEAMCCNTPVISTDCRTGPREILAPGTRNSKLKEAEFAEYGILAPNLINMDDKDILCWSQTITNILNKKEILNLYSKKGSERIQYFSIKSILEKWTSLLEIKS